MAEAVAEPQPRGLGKIWRRYLVRPPGFVEANKRESWGINAFVHHPWVAHTLDALLLVDVLAVVISLNLEVQFLKSEVSDFEHACLEGTCSMFADEHEAEETFEEFGKASLEDAEEGLVYLSIAILSLFVLEHLLLIVANQLEYFTHPIQVLDFIVVILSLVFELVFTEEIAVGLLILGRAWRFIRIGHGILDVEHHLRQERKALNARIAQQNGGSPQSNSSAVEVAEQQA